MDNACGLEITSEDYLDVISRYRLFIEEFERYRNNGACVNVINNTWAVLTFKASEVPEYSFASAGYFRIPKLYTLMDTSSAEEIGIYRLRNQPALDYRGESVLIGVVDTGIDYMHPVFINEQGKTRIKAIWDQNTTGDNPPRGIGYGNVYTENDINEAIISENPYERVPGDITQGHGTFLAGIAAGNDVDGEFTGIAPDAEIAVVKLKPAKKSLRDIYLINENAPAYSETDIMFGIKYLLTVAAKYTKSLVILIGLGTSYGSHTGVSPLEDYMAEVSRQYGTVVVVPTGNEGNARRHYYGQMSGAGVQTVELNVGRDERGFVLELWADSPDVYTVEFISPSGELAPRLPSDISGERTITFIFEKTKIYVGYRTIETISGKYLVIMRFDAPSEGIWRINVYGNQVVRGVYNMWLPAGNFLSSNTYFINSNPDITITAPGNVSDVITTAAYNHYTGAAYIESGRGFSANGVVKPDIAAPGVDVYGPVPGGGYTRRSGTSIAAANAAGCAALLLDWGNENYNLYFMNTANVKTILIKGAKRERTEVYPNRSTGYGKIDIYSSFESLRSV